MWGKMPMRAQGLTKIKTFRAHVTVARKVARLTPLPDMRAVRCASRAQRLTVPSMPLYSVMNLRALDTRRND